MAPLKGTTLGEKHQHYNALLKETIAKEYGDLPKINYDDDDIDNLMRIDIACHNRNVDYIFEVLKCSDMLYVTRAIKHSLWLITEPEFAHLINAQYLDTHLFPDMIPKAIAKLLLHIRLNIKDVERAEAFYTYENGVLKNTFAFKWLEKCSLEFIETNVKIHAANIPRGIIARLCRKSVKILEIYLRNLPEREYDHHEISLNYFMFLLKSDTEVFLNIAKAFSSCKINICFDAKATTTLMKRSFQRVVENFSWFENRIDLTILVKHLLINKIDIDAFLLSNCDREWLCFSHLKYFLIKIQPDMIIKLLKKMFGISTSEDQNSKNLNDDNKSKNTDKSIDLNKDFGNHSVLTVKPINKNRAKRSELEELFYKIQQATRYYDESRCIYRWYEFAPFDNAFQDLQNLIYAESSPEERHFMLIVLMKSARKNIALVKRVIQYYRERHINEPYIHKIKFVNSVLTLHDAFRFDDDTWNILTDLFYSLDVYIKSNNKVDKCIKAIVLHSIINKQPIPEIIEEKLNFDTFKPIKRKLSPTEQANLFDYLYNHWVRILQSLDMQRETGICRTIKLIEDIWNFLIEWGKEETHHGLVIDYIINIIDVKNKLQFKNDIRHLYYQVKPYHKLLFEKSLLLNPCEEMCMNALKHDPGLLVRYESEVTALCYDKTMSVRKLLQKLRIYWKESFASEWKNDFIDTIQQNKGHHLVNCVVILSPHSPLLDFIKLYAPCYGKIRSGELTDIHVSMQKQIAKSLYLARPQLPVEVVMWYAKGYALHHAQISLNSIYRNLRSKDIDKHIHILLNAPVLLKKQGVRLACKNMKTKELLDIFPSVWKSTRNSSVRTMIFVATFNFLDKAEDNLAIEICKLLSFMLDDFNGKANKKVCHTLEQLQLVPSCIINELYKKSFLFLRNMSKQDGCNNYASSFISVLNYAADIIRYLDSDFVQNMILSVPVYDIYFAPDSNGFEKCEKLSNVLTAYLICSRDENTQMEKYKSLMKPLFTRCVPEWKNNKFHVNIIKTFEDFLSRTAQYLLKLVPDMDIVMPVQMLQCIQKELMASLFDEEMYDLITQWKLYTAYIKILQMKMVEPNEFNAWEKIRFISINEFSKVCVEYLKEDIENNFPSIYMVFSSAMQKTLKYFLIEKDNFWRLLEGMLVCDNVQVYMLVLQITVEKDEYNSAKYRIHEKLRSSPSKEVRMHYYNYFSKEYIYRSRDISDSDSENEEDSGSDEVETSESESLSGEEESGGEGGEEQKGG